MQINDFGKRTNQKGTKKCQKFIILLTKIYLQNFVFFLVAVMNDIFLQNENRNENVYAAKHDRDET